MFPLSGPPARVLCQAAGIPPIPGESGYGQWTWALYEYFECRNVIERHGDAYPWSAPRARRAWTDYLLKGDRSRRPVVVVALGRKAAAAIGLREDRPYGEWLESGLLQAVAAPHPSGRSRIMNDPETRQLLGRVLNEALKRAERA